MLNNINLHNCAQGKWSSQNLVELCYCYNYYLVFESLIKQLNNFEISISIDTKEYNRGRLGFLPFSNVEGGEGYKSSSDQLKAAVQDTAAAQGSSTAKTNNKM